MIKFPQNFLWGAATSSYQVEGNNTNADWFSWELKSGHQNSGAACRHYELYKQDFDLAKGLHHNAHRLSIEWSRIEPQEGQFSPKELQHYIDVMLALRKRNIEPMVTLHHFTNPIWFSASGGWLDRRSVERFTRYSDFVVRGLGKHVHYWMTINEPTIYTSHSYLFGWWPPQEKSLWKTLAVQANLLRAHIKAYHLIHKIYKEFGLPVPAVGIAHHMPAIVTCSSKLRNRFAAFLRDKYLNFEVLDTIKDSMDFIGFNYYSRQLVDVDSWWPSNLMMQVCKKNHDPVTKNYLGWDIYPQGLYQVLLKLKKYNRPVIITENGICTLDDNQRWQFISDHLKSIHAAMEKGVDVRGYLHWSLLDNFEWDKGFGPRFGLIDIDYKTQKRMVRDSARKLGEVCKTGVLA